LDELILVYLELSGGGVTEGSLQALAMGAAWVGRYGGVMEALCVGGDSDSLNGVAGPLARLHRLSGAALSGYTAKGWGSSLEEIVSRLSPRVLIFPPGTRGEDLASWLGAAMGTGALLNAHDLRMEGGGVFATRVEFEGKVAVDYALEGLPAIVTVEEGVWEPPKGPLARLEIVDVPVSDKGEDTGVKARSTEVAEKTVDLRQARVVVGVGAGIGGRDGFEQTRELARLLGGELGATRAAVDAGWVAHERQIGQTGVKVKPDLYVACGISGAAQHRVGIMDSGTVVSINIDPLAPIFRFSHYSVVGDVRSVVPKLIELLRG
jgi:electron transfer flavoprotein alpha subunit